METRVCEECGGQVRTHPIYKDREGWVYCESCGLVVNGENIDRMCLSVFALWLGENCPNLGYRRKRQVLEVASKIGNRRALESLVMKQSLGR